MRACSVVSDSLQPHGCSPPGFSVLGILQARILEWVAISYSRGLPNLGMTLRFCSNQGEDWRRHLLHWVTVVDWMVQDSDCHI